MTKYRQPGFRRVRLLLWWLFNKTPFDKPIDEVAERAAANHCKMSWDRYCQLKQAHPELWCHHARKRAQAMEAGGFTPMPVQFRRWRNYQAPQRRRVSKPSPRLEAWAVKKLVRQRQFKRKWLRHLVLDRLLARVAGQ